jgi:hypothetical protein
MYDNTCNCFYVCCCCCCYLWGYWMCYWGWTSFVILIFLIFFDIFWMHMEIEWNNVMVCEHIVCVTYTHNLHSHNTFILFRITVKNDNFSVVPLKAQSYVGTRGGGAFLGVFRKKSWVLHETPVPSAVNFHHFSSISSNKPIAKQIGAIKNIFDLNY